MTAEEAVRQPVSSMPSGGARAVRISYRYDSVGAPVPEPGGRLIRGGLAAVPCARSTSARSGPGRLLARGDRVPEDEEIAELEALALDERAGDQNAQSSEARQLADVDALTGVHNRRYFQETLERECARAHRYERGIALVVPDIDDFKTTNDTLGHLAGDAVPAAVAERPREAVRQTDVVCRVGGDEFAVILPEAGAQDALQLYRRIQFAVGSGARRGPLSACASRPGSPSFGDRRTTPCRSSSRPTRPSPGQGELGKGQVQQAEAEAGSPSHALEPGSG